MKMTKWDGKVMHMQERYNSAIANAVVKAPHQQKAMPAEYANEKRLYTITTICYGENFTSTRCVGVCSDFNRVVQIVEDNEGDLFECAYRLVCVETILDNCIYGNLLSEKYWWVWDQDEEGADGIEGKYVPIQEPSEFKNIVGWGVG
jgi:hypothetical protein